MRSVEGGGRYQFWRREAAADRKGSPTRQPFALGRHSNAKASIDDSGATGLSADICWLGFRWDAQ
jgi:hypothetical protein